MAIFNNTSSLGGDRLLEKVLMFAHVKNIQHDPRMIGGRRLHRQVGVLRDLSAPQPFPRIHLKSSVNQGNGLLGKKEATRTLRIGLRIQLGGECGFGRRGVSQGRDGGDGTSNVFTPLNGKVAAVIGWNPT